MSAHANILTAVGIGAATAVAGVAGAGTIGAALAAAVAGWLAFAHERHRTAALLRARREQLAHTAHELRTPLTSVLTALEMVRGGYATTAAETDEFLAEADLAARHLGFLVNDVLDEAAITAGQLRMDLAEHRVQRLVTDALGLLGMQAERRGLSIAAADVDPGLFVVADARRVLQVLFNLLGNALKFSAAGEPIRVEVTAKERVVRFAVVDGGPGVPVDMRPRLFQPFSRGEAPGVTSTGLGLHITKHLVERMGGAIGYRPRPLRGSEFWFDLPRALPSSAKKPAIAPDPVAPR
jgi:signal transduction histidine kinase